jgi:hypothetical protein
MALVSEFHIARWIVYAKMCHLITDEAWERGDGELRPMSQVPLGDLHNKSEAPTLP